MHNDADTMFCPDIENEEQEKKEYLWRQQQRGYEQMLRIADGEMPEQVYGSSLLSRAFRLEGVKHYFGCMDGRVQKKDKKNKWMSKIGIGANGRLLDDLLFEKLVLQIRTVFEQVLHRNPSWIKVTYHAECGACAKYCGEVNPRRERIGLETITPVQAGKQVADQLMRDLNIQGDPVFIPSNWMEGDEHWHPERSVAIDTTGVSRPKELGDREHGYHPSTFELSGIFYPTLEHLEKETRIAIGIALNEHHGMGERFTNEGGENRLLLPIYEDPTNPELVEGIRRIIDPIGEEFQDRVLPVHFPVPEQYVRNAHQD